MSVLQSPRRHSERFQDTYGDATDEDEQYLLQPVDRPDRRRSAFCGRRSSPQDQDPRHTQLQATSRMFHDQQYAADGVPCGSFPNVSRPANNAGEDMSGTEHADPANNAGHAALPASFRQSHFMASQPSQAPFAEPSSDRHHALPGYQSYTRTSVAPGICVNARPPLSANAGAEDQRRDGMLAAKQPAGTASQAEHPQHPQRTTFDLGGGRGLFSSPSEPTDGAADLEQKSAFYRNASYKRTTSAKPPPLVLPELPILKFSGDIRSYPAFRNRFLETVGDRSDLGARHKFQYLLQFLDGEPLHLANSYLITDNNYFKLLDRLKDRYGDKGMLAQLLAQEFVNIRPAGEDVRDLRRFHDEALRLGEEMEQIGEDMGNNILWRQTLLSKMSKPLRITIYEKLGSDPFTAPVQEILARISDRLRILEKAEICFSWMAAASPAAESNSVAVESSDLNSQQCWEDLESNSTEYADDVQCAPAPVAKITADEQLQERRTCPLCGLLHSAADCTVYDTTNMRLRRALKLKLCLLCLREGHPAVSCPRRTTRPCSICRRGQHNRALCKGADNDKQRTDRRPSLVSATRDSRCDPEASDQQRHSRPSAHVKPSRRITEQPVVRDATCCVVTATTLRQSGTQSSLERISGNLINRKKRLKDLGTDPPGRTGTNRPPTTSTDESMKRNDADAYGSDRLLPGRVDLLQTDKCSTNRETMQFDRSQRDGSDEMPCGLSDEKESRELYNKEDFSHQPSDGRRTGAATVRPLDAPDDTRFPSHQESTAYVACASDSDEQPAVLHECLAVTAMNPVSRKSHRAVIMFDSGCDSSHVSLELAHFLDLPRHEMRVQNVSTLRHQNAHGYPRIPHVSRPVLRARTLSPS